MRLRLSFAKKLKILSPLLVMLQLAGLSVLLAQDVPDLKTILNDPTLMTELAKTMGTTPDDPRLKDWLYSKYNPQIAANYFKDSGLPIIKHYIVEEGINFPSPNDIKKSLASKLPAAEDIQSNSKAVEEYSASIQRYFEEQNMPKKFPVCQKQVASKIVIDPTISPEKDKLDFDFLFINKDDLPSGELDTIEVFGRATQLIAVSDDDSSTQSLAIGMAIDCLPQRVRGTHGALFRNYGADALKNFDKDFHGIGLLHVSAEELASKFK